MARREQPRIGVGGERRRLCLTVDDRDLEAVAIKLIGGGDAGNAGAENQRFHHGTVYIAASTMISTSSPGPASFDSTVARAGVSPPTTQASQTSFISDHVLMSVSQILALRTFVLSLPACFRTSSI